MSKFKTVKKNILVSCPACSGLGIVAKNNGADMCPRCIGTGEIVKVINEIVHDTELEVSEKDYP